MDKAVERYTQICNLALLSLPGNQRLDGLVACEVGAGDCLATAGLFLGLGARRVEIVEFNPPVATRRQKEVLERVAATGLPVNVDAVLIGDPPSLNSSWVAYRMGFMEEMNIRDTYDLIFSFSVVEHVEDLPAFFSSCHRALKPGGVMIHAVDLGGHGPFEDPAPPLDFQIYPNWLYWLMFPPYNRATRWPVGVYQQCAQDAGFSGVRINTTRVADAGYFQQIWPFLRRELRDAGAEQARVVEFVLHGYK
ncbi:MAG: methyltransferase domain-containing protein [Verrucomicrobiia bacterium]